MADKIVQATAQTIIANANIYAAKPVSISTPTLVAADTSTAKIVTAVESPKVLGTVTNMGEEVLPNPSLFKRAHDFYHVSDTLKLTYKLSKSDILSGVSDLFNRVVQYKRVFQESQVTNDSYKTFRVTKSAADVVHYAEQLRNRLGKTLSDSFTKTERFSFVGGKNVFDTVTNTEELLKVAYKKAANELVTSSDVLSRVVAFNRSFQDIVDATDDFYGAANVDDDQIAKVGKTLVDWVASSEIRSVVLSIVKADSVASTEQKAVRLTKPFFDTGTAGEQARLNPQKVLSDATTNTELVVRRPGKGLVDTSTTSDTKSANTGKKLLDTGTAQDQFKYTGTKILSDQSVTSDAFSRTWQALRTYTDSTTNTELTFFRVSPKFLDTATSIEQARLNTGKTLSDNYTTSDYFTRTVDYKRSFSDLVDSTDDFYGAANIDDDQVVNVGKTNIDWVTYTEQLSFFGSKTLSDTFTKTDVIANTPKKVLSDQFTKTDVAYSRTGKTTQDTTSTQDVPAKNSGKTLADTGTSSDLFARTVNYNRTYTDQATNTDTQYLAPAKVLADTSVSSDVLSRIVSFNRTYTDTVNRSEVTSFASKPTKLDTVSTSNPIALSVARPLTDAFTRTDTVRNTPQKVAIDSVLSSDVISFYKYTNRYFADIATTNDGGVINNQSYFAGTYIEPGYVGTNTYFS
jgi:hypothetical protein